MNDTTNSMAEQVVASADDAIIVADRDGIIRLWNAAAERILGFPAEQAMGRSLDLIIPEKHRKTHWDGYDKVMATGTTKYAGSLLAVPALTADGTRISVEFTVTLLPDGNGRVEGIAAIMRDVSERYQKQRAMQRELRDLRSRVASSPAPATSAEAGQ
jgi:PAS domain S-box-containing protein